MPRTCNRVSPVAICCGRISSPARRDDPAAVRAGKAELAHPSFLSITPVAPERGSSGTDRVGLGMRLCSLYTRLLQGADPSEGVSMKIVGFEANGGLHLGV